MQIAKLKKRIVALLVTFFVCQALASVGHACQQADTEHRADLDSLQSAMMNHAQHGDHSSIESGQSDSLMDCCPDCDCSFGSCSSGNCFVAVVTNSAVFAGYHIVLIRDRSDTHEYQLASSLYRPPILR